jgi:hypothetical protein
MRAHSRPIGLVHGADVVTDPLTPDRALRRAWQVWLLLAVLPWLATVAAVWEIVFGPARAGDSARAAHWFVGVTAYLVVAVPAALFWRGRLFRCYTRGHAVPPRAYVRGMAAVWGALAVGGVAAAAGCLATRTLMPCAAPACPVARCAGRQRRGGRRWSAGRRGGVCRGRGWWP